MLPSDVLGVTIYNVHSEAFEFKPGPIFTNFLLADEINRTTPKTQSALLEAMNERQVTIDGRSHALATPFMVIATQNPVEHHGTYPLPESQLDRFLMRLRIGYPDTASERDILRNFSEPRGAIEPVLSTEEILQLQAMVHRVTVDESLVDYMLAIVEKTRAHDSLALGVSPRGSQALFRAAQALRWSKAATTRSPTIEAAGRPDFRAPRGGERALPRRSGAAIWATSRDRRNSEPD
jgi:MoxR-like ATPase